MGRRSAVTTQRHRVEEPVTEPADDTEVVTEADTEVYAEVDAEIEVEADSETVKLDSQSTATDNVGEQSVEINVEGLIAELEAETSRANEVELNSARRKLEDYLEQKRIARDLEDLDDFDI